MSVCCWEILLFVMIPLSYFVYQSCKGIKDGRKKDESIFRLEFYFGFFSIIQWCGMFSRTSRNNQAPQTRRLKNIIELFFASYKLSVRHVSRCC